MSNEKEIKPYAPPTITDGWAEAAAASAMKPIRGTLLLFRDHQWLAGSDGKILPHGTSLVATSTAVAWVHWKNGKPDDIVINPSGKPLPERQDLGENDPSEWETGPDGEVRDPWAYTNYIYLVHPTTTELFTFSTSTIGGSQCVADLAGQIGRVRGTHPDAIPIVGLHSGSMKTRYGQKAKPVLEVTGWRGVVETRAAPQIEAPRAEAPRPRITSGRRPPADFDPPAPPPDRG
jgi:hypothetical protein